MKNANNSAPAREDNIKAVCDDSVVTDAMDKPAEELKELNSSDGACHISLAYLAEKFENHAKDILHKLQELANSSDDIVSVPSLHTCTVVLCFSLMVDSRLFQSA